MSEYVNHDTQLAPLDDFGMQLDSDMDFDSIDWTLLNEKVMQEPWMDDFDWSGYYEQGTDAVAPGVGFFSKGLAKEFGTSTTPPNSVGNTIQSQEPTPERGDRKIAPRAHKRSFTCDSPGCKSKIFGSRSDLHRHQLAHDTRRWHSCTAVDCPRKGKKGFYRADKLKDHMIAGHDNDTLFACPRNHFDRDCGGLVLTRDFMAIHAGNTYLNEYRDCPLPKCPYRIYLGRKGTSLDALQAHLVTKHDARGRENFTGRIRERGYDTATGEIICPICLGAARFADHSSFYHHFFAAHFDGSTVELDASVTIFPCFGDEDPWTSWGILGECTFVPDGVRQCRRTILSLWPNFENYPVWEDVKCP